MAGSVARDDPPRDPVRWTRRERLAVALAALLGGLLLVATSNPGPAIVNDARAAALASWSLGTQGELALPVTWPASANYWGVETPDGRVHVNRFPGVAYWAAPAYVLADLVQDGEPAPAHPYLVDLRPAAWSAVASVLAALVVAYALLRELVPRRAAALATVALGTGTALWSVAADTLWPHGPTALALLSVLWAWRRDHLTVAAGGAALGILVRPHLVVALAVVAVWGLWREPGQRRGAAGIALGTVVGLALLIIYSDAVFGTWWPAAGYDVAGHLGGLVTHSPWQTLRAYGLALVSPSRGVLLLSPLVALAGVAVVRAWRELPRWTVIAALAGLLQLLVQVRAVGHAGGAGFFGARVSLESLVLATPALAVALSRWARDSLAVRVAALVLGIVGIGVHAYGAGPGSVPADDLARWERIVATVEDNFSGYELGEVDLRRMAP